MDSKDELLPEEDQITPKIEPIDTDFIKEEEFLEEECSVDPGVTVSFKVNKVSLKEEVCDKEEIEDCLLSNVWNTVLFNDASVDLVFSLEEFNLILDYIRNSLLYKMISKNVVT